MKYYVFGYSQTEAKATLIAFDGDYKSAVDFALRVDGELIGISADGVPSLWPEPVPVRFKTMEEVLES